MKWCDKADFFLVWGRGSGKPDKCETVAWYTGAANFEGGLVLVLEHDEMISVCDVVRRESAGQWILNNFNSNSDIDE